MGFYYYLTSNNEQRGPIEGSQLVANGVTPQTLVWTQGMEQWAPAGSVAELQGLFPPQGFPASVPPPPCNPQPTAQPLSPAGNNYNRSEYVAPAAQANPASAPNVGSNQSGMNMPPKPDNNMIWAVLCTVLCCIPVGIYAIICANDVDKLYAAGNYEGACDRARAARTWSIVGAVASIVIIVFYFILLAAGVFTSANY